jgi:methylthioribose-1-phosphate isomerase
LLPLHSRYKAIDHTARTFSGEAALLALNVLTAPFIAIRSAFSLAMRFYHDSADKKSDETRRRERQENPSFDYGLAATVRERLASDSVDHYFQKLDQEMYVKLFEAEILDALKAFLTSKGIDISEFSSQQSVIVNSGVIVHGGLQAETLAVGKRARAITTLKALGRTPQQPQA